ncbi:hypothetical protein D9753_35260 [Streptomyces dangxiongensis]|uniref:Uncharacterized protein n=1 Tax=Streptomyces dangxiongensis TaxID=1442032 RepID=A0A3G2JRE1_9ACTN|nr:hypothetical protein D9753_35260 [Streptomyces dangxiongensis]
MSRYPARSRAPGPLEWPAARPATRWSSAAGRVIGLGSGGGGRIVAADPPERVARAAGQGGGALLGPGRALSRA